MNWKPVLPKIEWPLLIAHIPSMVLYWSVYIVGLYAILSFGHGFVSSMFANITDYVVIALAVAVPVVWAMIMGYSRFISNQKDIKVAEKEAKLNSESVVDTVNAELGAKYWYGYLILGIFGAAICAFLGLYITDVIAARGYIAGEEEIALAAVGISTALEIVADVYVINNLGDVAFFVKKEKDAIDKFLNGDLKSTVEEGLQVVKTAKQMYDEYIALGFTDEEAQAQVKANQAKK